LHDLGAVVFDKKKNLINHVSAQALDYWGDDTLGD